MSGKTILSLVCSAQEKKDAPITFALNNEGKKGSHSTYRCFILPVEDQDS